MGSNTQLDGVIMVDPVFLQELTKISGNVTIPDGTVLTGDNTAEFLLNKVYVDYPVSMQDTLTGWRNCFVWDLYSISRM